MYNGYSIAIIFPLIDAIRLDKFSRAASGFAESLANPASFEKFKIFSIIDFSVENVLFYDKVRRLRALAIKKQSTSSCGNGVRRHRSNTTDTAASGEALARRIDKEIRNIYVKFIVPGSEYELNLEHDTRKSIMKAMQQDEFNITLYDAAFNEISSLLINNTYPRFLQWKSGQSKTDDIETLAIFRDRQTIDDSRPSRKYRQWWWSKNHTLAITMIISSMWTRDIHDKHVHHRWSIVV
ncbi:RGS domain-containing protein [Syncephalis plumigaleata]|nr:RGS domain-containing protein [Syncephalis plumigaleata]